MKRRMLRLTDTYEETEPTNIYFIQCGHFTKIGIAVDIKERIRLFQIGNPVKLELLKSFTTVRPFRHESDLHLLLDRHSVRGEWFQLPDHHTCTIKNSTTIENCISELSESLG